MRGGRPGRGLPQRVHGAVARILRQTHAGVRQRVRLCTRAGVEREVRRDGVLGHRHLGIGRVSGKIFVGDPDVVLGRGAGIAIDKQPRLVGVARMGVVGELDRIAVPLPGRGARGIGRVAAHHVDEARKVSGKKRAKQRAVAPIVERLVTGTTSARAPRRRGDRELLRPRRSGVPARTPLPGDGIDGHLTWVRRVHGDARLGAPTSVRVLKVGINVAHHRIDDQRPARCATRRAPRRHTRRRSLLGYLTPVRMRKIRGFDLHRRGGAVGITSSGPLRRRGLLGDLTPVRMRKIRGFDLHRRGAGGSTTSGGRRRSTVSVVALVLSSRTAAHADHRVDRRR